MLISNAEFIKYHKKEDDTKYSFALNDEKEIDCEFNYIEKRMQ